MFKDFLIRKMLKNQLKGVPEGEQEKLIAMITENPELFQTIATEVQERVKGGMDQMQATMEVMKRHEAALSKLKEKMK